MTNLTPDEELWPNQGSPVTPTPVEEEPTEENTAPDPVPTEQPVLSSVETDFPEETVAAVPEEDTDNYPDPVEVDPTPDTSLPVPTDTTVPEVNDEDQFTPEEQAELEQITSNETPAQVAENLLGLEHVDPQTSEPEPEPEVAPAAAAPVDAGVDATPAPVQDYSGYQPEDPTLDFPSDGTFLGGAVENGEFHPLNEVGSESGETDIASAYPPGLPAGITLSVVAEPLPEGFTGSGSASQTAAPAQDDADGNGDSDSAPKPSPFQLTPEDIAERFGFHRATIEGPEATQPLHASLRLNFQMFANFLNSGINVGREYSLMFTALEEASMWAHKAIAKNAPLETESFPEGPADL